MLINEFRWGVKPKIPGHWHETLSHDGFEVEIGGDWIEARKQDDGARDAQQVRAEQIVDGVVRKIGLHERTKFTLTLGFTAQFNPGSNQRHVHLRASGGGKATGHADMVLTNSDGTVVRDTRKERMAGLLQFANVSSANATLRRLVDYLLEYHGDPEKKLAPLYDIIELTEKIFGSKDKAAVSLGISVKQMKAAGAIINDKQIRSSRHRGQEVGTLREPTRAELQSCEAVAQKIIEEYTNLVVNGRAPM
jgi:hypothetical protein